MDCIFCKIAAGEIPSTKVFENDKILAFTFCSGQNILVDGGESINYHLIWKE